MPLLFWDRERGTYLGGRDEEGARDKDSPDESAWRTDERRKQLAESKRLFYVALTRARERLVLACPRIEPEKKPRDPEVSAYSIDYWRGWLDEYGGVDEEGTPSREDRLAQAGLRSDALNPDALNSDALTSDGVTAVASDADDEPEFLLKGSAAESPLAPRRQLEALPARLQRPRHSVTEWTLLSRCPRAYEWRFVRPRAAESRVQQAFNFSAPPSVETPSQVPSGEPGIDRRELGSRVHACLERGDYAGLAKLEEEAGEERFKAAALQGWATDSSWMRPADAAEARDVWTELAFEARVPTLEKGMPAEVLVGSIDRLVREERPNGSAKFTILDFKITGRPKAEAELRETYQTQIDLYAWAVTSLDPTAAGAEIDAALVAISPESVAIVEVKPRMEMAERLAAEAAEIVAGAAGPARPGSVCRHCEFRDLCPDAR